MIWLTARIHPQQIQNLPNKAHLTKLSIKDGLIPATAVPSLSQDKTRLLLQLIKG
jgi:hypothetical protein